MIQNKLKQQSKTNRNRRKKNWNFYNKKMKDFKK